MKTNHKFFLNLAFQIAEKNLGKTNQNPSVGSVVVKNNTVISSGITSVGGRPHAEFNALKNKNTFKGADLYTTLEPCTHYGFTPPCVNLIIKKKINNVFYSFEDPDKRTFKKAKKKLQKKNIYVRLIKNDKFKSFYSSYFINKKFKIPFISAKIAISKDFFTINKKSKWITGEHSRKITHFLRSQNDCIVSTSKSINKDNSLLNCRIDRLNTYNPDLLIIDLNLKLNKFLALNKIVNKRKTFIITKKENKKNIKYFKKKGFKIIFIDALDSKNDFKKLFKNIYELGYNRVFFETGLTFLNTLINFKLLNQLYVFQNNINLKKNGSNNCSSRNLQRIKLNKKIRVNLNNDMLYKQEF